MCKSFKDPVMCVRLSEQSYFVFKHIGIKVLTVSNISSFLKSSEVLIQKAKKKTFYRLFQDTMCAAFCYVRSYSLGEGANNGHWEFGVFHCFINETIPFQVL